MRAKVRMPTDEEEAAIQRGIAADPDTFEVTAEHFATARPAAEVLPAPLYAELTKRRGRPPTGTPAKVLVSIRVAPDVLARLRASGPGLTGASRGSVAEARGRLAPPRSQSNPFEKMVAADGFEPPTKGL